MKYGDHNFWSNKASSNCSDFFKGLCLNIDVLKPFLWINCLNPTITSFLFHPWMFEIPIAYKPVYLNMDVNVDNFQIDSLLVNTTWNLDALNMMFGTNFNSLITCHGKTNNDEVNHWVWFHEFKGNKLSSNVYKFLNSKHLEDQEWCG